ncbi:unnamed protein product [Ectocarpus sp. CCAP 1310/34]|nr:unnamed protein product [Ectocarpus sp. CCAP 1310/34]
MVIESTTEPPDLCVQRDGPRHVSIEAPQCRTTPRQKESFEVTRVLPLNATPEEIFAGSDVRPLLLPTEVRFGVPMSLAPNPFTLTSKTNLKQKRGVGGPVVDWLWDGFNAVVLSYGQARSGKTSLLVGKGAPLTETPGESSQRAQCFLNGNSEPVGIGSGRLGKGRRRGDKEGLLKDILRDIFDKAAAAGPADAADPVLVACQEKQLSPTTGEPPYEICNPLAGSWSPSRHANDSPGFDVCPGGIGTLLGTQELTPRGGGTATVQTKVSGIDSQRWEGRRDSAKPVATADRIYGSEIMNETGKQTTRPSLTGESGRIAVVALSAWEVAGKHVTDLFVDPSPDSGSTGGSNDGRKDSMGNSSSSIEVNDKGTRGVGGRSRSRNRSNRNRAAGSGCSREGGNRGGGRRNSRGRSGSDDSSSTGAGWPTGYPEGFLSVRAPNLSTALELVDAAQSRCSACRRQRAIATSEAAKGSRGKGGGGGKAGGAAVAESAAAAANSSHVFFRVVVYNTLEETASTLHMVDLAGGWEPPSEKPTGRRGSKCSGMGTVRPSAVSREWNSFDAMMVGLVPPPPPPPPATAVPHNRVNGSDCNCGHIEKGGIACDADRATAVKAAAAASGSRPAPPPTAHPVFGSPKGKTFGGGGGGKLVETLRPLISGNTRTWLVVSVGGDGKGGGGAAWRALDVARRATGISTTCIRLRGVALTDLRLRSSSEVLPVADGCGTSNPEDDFSASINGASNRRRVRTRASTSATSVDIGTALTVGSPLNEPSRVEQSLLSTAGGGQNSTTFGSPEPEQVLHAPISLGPSLSGLSEGERSLFSFRERTGDGGEERAGSSSVDEFLAGFVRGGGDDDDRPRPMSSGGVVQADVTLENEPEQATPAGQLIAAALGGRGDENRSGVEKGKPSRNSKPTAFAASVVQGSLSFGEQRQHYQHAPQLQGSRLRPGGRAATVGPKPSADTPSTTSFAYNGGGSPRGFENDGGEEDDDDPPTTLRESRLRSEAFSRKVAAGEPGVENAEAESPAESRARENIDLMMSSLLEEVLPDRRRASSTAGPAVASLSSEGGGGHHAASPAGVSRDRTAAAFATADAVARQSSSSRSPLPRGPTSPSVARRSDDDHSAPAMQNTPDHATFLTPIEVLMRTPAGGGSIGCKSTREEKREEKQGHCRQCTASDDATPTSRAETSRRANEESLHPSGWVHGQAPNVRAVGTSGQSADERTSIPTPLAGDFVGRDTGGTNVRHRSRAASSGTGDALSRLSRGSSSGSSSGGGGTRRSSRGLSTGGARQTTDQNPDERDGGECMNVEVGSARAEKNGAHALEDELDGMEDEGGALLGRHHAALLRVVREQEDRGKQMIRRFEAKECDWLERVTTLEADLQGLRAEAVETRGRLRRAEESSPSAEVFKRYEAHVGILEAENTSLRDRNISLELRLLDILRQSTAAASSRGGTTLETETNSHLSPSGCHQHQHHAALFSTRATTAGEKEGNKDSEICPKQHKYGTGALQQSDASATACVDGGTTSRFRVDGSVPVSGSVGEAGKPWASGGAPMCAAVLKDLRRRLKEAELEAKEMRAERAAVDKRDRLCQAQLRTLKEQRSKLREFMLRERELEAKLTASRLESARAEVAAEDKAAEVEHLLDNQAALVAEREDLVLALAEERKKSRQFDEDRVAYGHIRRFIERHAGGRPAEWDKEESVVGHDQVKDVGARRPADNLESVGKERKYPSLHRQQVVGMGNTPGGAPRGHREAGERVKESAMRTLDERMATRRSSGGRAVNGVEEGGGCGGSFETLRPRKSASTIDATPSGSCQGVATDGSRHLYSDVYRHKLSARVGANCRNDDDARSSYGTGAARFREDSSNYSHSHYALKFTGGSERIGKVDPLVQRTPLKGSLKAECSRKADGGYSSHGKTATPDDDWPSGGGGEHGPGVHDNENAEYYDSSFATAKAVEG